MQHLLKAAPHADVHVCPMISVHADKYAVEHVRPAYIKKGLITAVNRLKTTDIMASTKIFQWTHTCWRRFYWRSGENELRRTRRAVVYNYPRKLS